MRLPKFLQEKRSLEREEEERREFDASDPTRLTAKGKAYLAVEFVERSAREQGIIPDFRGVKPNAEGRIECDLGRHIRNFDANLLIDLDIEDWCYQCMKKSGKLPVLVFVGEKDAIAVYTGEKKLALTEKCCDKRAEDAEKGR